MAEASCKLTKRVVDAALPKVERYSIWDSQLRGFGLRVAPSGTKTYILRYRPRNAGPSAPKRFVVLGRHGAITPDEARTRASTTLGAVSAGPCAGAQAVASGSDVRRVGRGVPQRSRTRKAKGSDRAGYEAVLKSYFLPQFGKRKAETITAGEIAKVHLTLRDRPYQANRIVAIVASMYGFAGRRGLVPKGTNPAGGLERFREEKRERYLGTDELRRLGETLRLAGTDGLPWRLDSNAAPSKHLPREENRRTVLPPEVILAFCLLILTGARLREILHLEWSHVDMERGLLLLPDSKTGRKTIVLNSPALSLLERAERRGRFVIPGGSDPARPRSDLKKAWHAIQQHAGLVGVRIHDLRHTFASIGAGASLGLPIVGKLLGHSQPATTARYAHLDADPLRRGTNLIGQKLSDAMGL